MVDEDNSIHRQTCLQSSNLPFSIRNANFKQSIRQQIPGHWKMLENTDVIATNGGRGSVNAAVEGKIFPAVGFG
jgi:hypothetical protein